MSTDFVKGLCDLFISCQTRDRVYKTRRGGPLDGGLQYKKGRTIVQLKLNNYIEADIVFFLQEVYFLG